MEVYFDNSATTIPYKEVINLVASAMENSYANPSSAYKIGIDAEKEINKARDFFAKSINCSREEIIFTSGGSESNNFAIKAFAKNGCNIVTTSIEHPSIINTCKDIEADGVEVRYLDVDSNGRVNLEQLKKYIDKNTQLVSVMHVNNEMGIIQDLETIGSIVKEYGIRAKFHVDAVQSYGKFKIDVQKFKIDLLSVSSHKIHGPRGIGFSYLRKGLSARPLICGGGQERGVRSGTENIAGILGFAKAAEIVNYNLEKNYNNVGVVKDYFINKLKEIDDITINSPQSQDISNYILSVSFGGVKAEVLLHVLEESEIYVSTGSACSSKSGKDSYVLKSIGLKPEQIKGTTRFSFCENNTIEEAEYTISKLKEALKFLRRLKI
ncbi:MAG: cysteine desulfurase family protein [Bacillota bacterium]|nr:cysteine desulfurase family protein [Bacillota bacterium]